MRARLGPHHRHRLLRARRERPRRCAAEQRDELAPFHSITSSARASSMGGTSRPSALAVLRLMTNFEFGRLHDRQFRRPHPFENSTGIDTSKAPSVRNAGSVANQAAASDKLRALDGRPPKKVIVVPQRIVNVVL